jgi:predicted metal-dependent phosphoesterase TrpH
MHVHTTASDGTATPREVLEFVSAHTNLSVVAICDHNTNEGALEASGYASEYGVEVVVGQEVESTQGHILGLWTPELIAPGRSAAETVANIHAQGGLAVAAHPYAPRWWHKHGLCRGETEVYDCVEFDGVEVANSTPLLLAANFRARKYWRANRERLAATGGSDAHMLSIIGTSRTVFPGSTAADLRNAIQSRTTRGHGPTFNPVRLFFYARKVPEIKERDRDRKAREAERGVEGCDVCGSCATDPVSTVSAEKS